LDASSVQVAFRVLSALAYRMREEGGEIVAMYGMRRRDQAAPDAPGHAARG